jgi:hypothetical protein
VLPVGGVLQMIDSTGAAAVDPNYFWLPIDENTPRNVKLQLIGKSGVAMYSTYNGKDEFHTHWAPLPKFKKDEK